MSNKGRGFREPRKRGFDDDNYSPREDRGGGRQSRGGGDRFGGPPPRGMGMGGGGPMPGGGAEVDATVKWFNPEKGFGFVELSNGSGDAFLHVATLQSTGRDSVEPGTTMKVQVGQGPKGAQVTAVIAITGMGEAPARPPRRTDRGPSPGRERSEPMGPASEVSGTVKWFNADKGFGFVVADDGGKDIFVHISVLERSGVRALPDGQKVTMMVEQRAKGREAISIALAE